MVKRKIWAEEPFPELLWNWPRKQFLARHEGRLRWVGWVSHRLLHSDCLLLARNGFGGCGCRLVVLCRVFALLLELHEHVVLKCNHQILSLQLVLIAKVLHDRAHIVTVVDFKHCFAITRDLDLDSTEHLPSLFLYGTNLRE